MVNKIQRDYRNSFIFITLNQAVSWLYAV